MQKLPKTALQFLFLFLTEFLPLFVSAECGHRAFFYGKSGDVSSSRWEIAAYETFEIGIEREKGCKEIQNPYDIDEIVYTMQVKRVSSGGETKTFQAFYYQAFTDTVFEGYSVAWKEKETDFPYRIRLAMEEAGEYNLVFFQKELGGEAREIYRRSLTVTPNAANRHGFLKFSPVNHRYLQFSDGTPFFAIGEKMSYFRDIDMPQYIRGIEPMIHYSPRTLPEYFRCVEEMSVNGGNFIFILFCPWSFDVEGRETKILGEYSPYQKRLSDLDSLLRFCEQRGVYVQLSLIDHTILEQFGVSPYYTLVSEITKKIDFFTNFTVKQKIRQRLAYLNARYGQMPVVSAFEVFSETETCGNEPINDTLSYGLGRCPNPLDGGKTAIPCKGLYWNDNHPNIINRWVLEMSGYLRSLNPRIPIANAVGDVSLWRRSPFDNVQTFSLNPKNNEALTFLSVHAYLGYRTSDYLKNLLLRIYSTDSTPVQLGETGWGGAMSGCPAREIVDNEMHNMIWSSSFSGAFGCGLEWWWQDCTHRRANWTSANDKPYKHFAPLSRFWEGENLALTHWKPVCTPPVWDSLGKDQWNYELIFRYPNKSKGIVTQSDLSLLNPEISVSDSVNIEAFALQSATKILGWVHLKDNFMRNLPRDIAHDSEECKEIYQKNPPPQPILPIAKSSLTFQKVRCNGAYRLTWWNPYYLLSDTNVQTKAEGELRQTAFESYQNQSIIASNQQLKIAVPPLYAYDMTQKNPFLPDYGWKLSLVLPFLTDNWEDPDFNGKWKVTPIESDLTVNKQKEETSFIQKKNAQNQKLTYIKTIEREIAIPALPNKRHTPFVSEEDSSVLFIGKNRQLYLQIYPDTFFQIIALPDGITPQKNTPLLYHQQSIWLMDKGGYPVVMKKFENRWITAHLEKEQYRENALRFPTIAPKTPFTGTESGVMYLGKDGKSYLIYAVNPCRCED